MKTKEKDLCKCEKLNGVYTVNGEWGYWLHCMECKKEIEEGFTYYNDDEIE
jgi:hypothetical protein